MHTLRVYINLHLLIRDYTGRLLVAKSCPLIEIAVLTAEAIGACNGVKCVLFHIGARIVWLAGDAARVVQWIQKATNNKGYKHLISGNSLACSMSLTV